MYLSHPLYTASFIEPLIPTLILVFGEGVMMRLCQ